MTTIRLDYDDTELDIIEKVNDILQEHGLKFVDDGLEHDGYIIMNLVTKLTDVSK
jgi:hypothetical protein